MQHSPDTEAKEMHLHAACVAAGDKAVLIIGASGSGKSALALELLGYGAMLVADDQTIVRETDGRIMAIAPDSIRGLIEARGVGILKAAAKTTAQVALVVDMDCVEVDRLPHPRETLLLGVAIPLCLKVEAPHFAAAILQLLRYGRSA